MFKISYNFHALPDEIMDLVEECSKEFNLNIVVTQRFPVFRLYMATWSNLRIIIKKLDIVNRIYLCCHDVNMSAYSDWDFTGKNPDSLLFEIGKYNEESLAESWLAAKTDDQECLKIWRKVVSSLKKRTLTGAWVVNPHTGAKAYYKNHRYTETAKRLDSEGIEIRPIGGWNLYLLINESEIESAGSPDTRYPGAKRKRPGDTTSKEK